MVEEKPKRLFRRSREEEKGGSEMGFILIPPFFSLFRSRILHWFVGVGENSLCVAGGATHNGSVADESGSSAAEVVEQKEDKRKEGVLEWNAAGTFFLPPLLSPLFFREGRERILLAIKREKWW